MFASYYLDGQAVTGNYNSFVLVLEHSPALKIAKVQTMENICWEGK